MGKNSTKTKILFVITKSTFGGAQHYVYDLATNIPHEQFEIVVVLGGHGLLKQKLVDKGIRTVSLIPLERNVNFFRDIASFVHLWRLFRTERPDIIHLNSAKASGLGALAGHLAGVPKIIFTAHGWAFNEDRSLFSRWVIKFLSWLTVILSHVTITVSKAVESDTENWPFIREKVTTIHNGLGHIDFLPREEARKYLVENTDLVILHNTFLVGTIAELHKNKGFDYAIHGFSLCAAKNLDLRYAIIGQGEEKSSLSTHIDARKLHERVLLLGFLENASRYLKAFDVFLLPSIKEGLPYVILEAGAAGVPIIASNIGGIPEIIEHEKTGLLVTPKDSVAISEAITLLVNDPEKGTVLGTTLEKNILHIFSLEKMIKKTTELYRS